MYIIGLYVKHDWKFYKNLGILCVSAHPRPKTGIDWMLCVKPNHGKIISEKIEDMINNGP